MSLLEIDDLSIRFGGIVALDGVSFDVEQGQILGIIGPNGAGKTTIFNCVSRYYQPHTGSIVFAGVDMLALPAHRVMRIGIARTFQQAELFKSMSVYDNLLVGEHTGRGRGLGLLWPWRMQHRLSRRAEETLEFLELQDVRNMPAGALPFGLQKRVDVARALVAGPRLLLLDEPAAGLNHEELRTLGRLIQHIRDDLHVTVMLVEHHMELVMNVSDRVCVLDFGRKIAEGTPSEVQRDPAVIEAYLGETVA